MPLLNFDPNSVDDDVVNSGFTARTTRAPRPTQTITLQEEITATPLEKIANAVTATVPGFKQKADFAKTLEHNGVSLNDIAYTIGDVMRNDDKGAVRLQAAGLAMRALGLTDPANVTQPHVSFHIAGGNVNLQAVLQPPRSRGEQNNGDANGAD